MRFLGLEKRDAQAAAVDLSDPAVIGWLGGVLDGGVSEETATTCVAVLACIRVRAETLASLPCHAYRPNEDGGIDRIEDGTADLLERRPNDFMTPYQFWAWKQQSEDIHGNAYALKIRNGRGRVTQLWPLNAAAMTVKHVGGKMAYQYAGDEDIPAQLIHPSDLLHFKGSILKDPFEGESLVRLTKGTLKLGKEAEQFFDMLLNNGNHFPTYITAEPGTSPRAVEDFKAQLKGKAGLWHAGETLVFGPGLRPEQNKMTLQEMDFSPQLRWNLEQVSRIWRVPLPIINDLTHGTYTNSEQASIWLAQYTMTPVCKATEQVLSLGLFPRGSYAEFNMDGLQRGDYNSRTAGYLRMTSGGIMTRNEVRRKENLNPLPGLDEPLISLANGTVSEDGSVVNPNVVEPVAKDARSRIAARFAKDGPTERSWEFARTVAAPVVESLALAGIVGTVDEFVEACID